MTMRLCRGIAAILITLIFLPATIATAANKYLVVLDPAHGGSDKGVRLTNTVYEKDVTLFIAGEIRKEIGTKGPISIKLTRTADEDLASSERIQMARASKADLFVAIHVNAGFGRSSSGYEVYFPGFRKGPEQQGGSSEIVDDMVRNKFLNESVRFAQHVMRNIEPIFPRQGRGLREAPVPGFDELDIPAVVIELAFATNIENRKKLTQKDAQKAIAEALSKSIKEYFTTMGQSGEK